MKDYYNWLYHHKHILSTEYSDWDNQKHIGYMWEYLYNKVDMNSITSSWNFDASDIYSMLSRRINLLEAGK